MSDWNPELYLKFERERTQPVRDLVARIEIPNPARIIDIGCGPGNSTAVLRRRWPGAVILGLDNSPAMLEKARQAFPTIKWVEADAGADLSHLGRFDIVFANASLQWVPNHRELMPRLFRMLAAGGALAVQIPKFEEMPIASAIEEVTRLPEFSSHFSGFDSGLSHFENGLYYDALCSHSRVIELWVTHYHHVLANHEAIIEWTQSTGMRPYLDRVPEPRHREFKGRVLERVRQHYPARCDGKVLFIFKRFFLLAYAA
jgi:trans-aconitate 2-methyltransferase